MQTETITPTIRAIYRRDALKKMSKRDVFAAFCAKMRVHCADAREYTKADLIANVIRAEFGNKITDQLYSL